MKTAICAIVKDEHKFIKEWVDYHLSIGFDAIHIYEDYASMPHNSIFADTKYRECVFIEQLKNNKWSIPNTKTAHKQFLLYQAFLNACKKGELQYDWVLFNDVDEFLVFEDGYSLQRLIEDCADWDAIWLSWRVYGASGHIKSPHPELDVMHAYTIPSTQSCDRDNRWNLKSFVNTKKCNGFNNLHEANGGKLTNGKHWSEIPRGKMPYQKAWLNHYYSKSWEDYCDRMFKRGNVFNVHRSFDEFFLTNEDMLPQREKLIQSIRNKKLKGAMWISRELKIISGGNVKYLEELKDKYLASRAKEPVTKIIYKI